jgi:hypothetical protein
MEDSSIILWNLLVRTSLHRQLHHRLLVGVTVQRRLLTLRLLLQMVLLILFLRFHLLIEVIVLGQGLLLLFLIQMFLRHLTGLILLEGMIVLSSLEEVVLLRLRLCRILADETRFLNNRLSLDIHQILVGQLQLITIALLLRVLKIRLLLECRLFRITVI